MALQLISLGHEVSYIDISADRVPCTFSVKLTDKTFTLTFKYNDVGGFFTADLSEVGGEVLAFGDPVRYGRPMFGSIEDERFPLPVIIPQCLTGEEISEVTEGNLGNAVRLYLHDRKVG